MTQTQIAAPRTRLAWLTTVPIVIAVAALVSVLPVVAAGLVAGVVGITLIGLRATRTAFYTTLFVVLVGYMFLGRGFAYLGVPPLYVSEIALALAVFALVTTGPVRRMGPAQWLILAFMAWGAYRTIPYIDDYGIDAFRDGVIWIYAAFALVLSLLMTSTDVRGLIRRYGQVVPIFILALPFLAAAWFIGREGLIPTVPGTDVQILFFKPGDMGVHLAGAAAFFLAGFSIRPGTRRLIQPIVWLAWLVGFVIVASYSRAAMLASGMAAVVILFRRHLDRWATPFLISILVIGLIGASGAELDIGRRSISIEQLIDNVASVTGDTSNPELTGTREWREEWWSRIIDYTIDGPYIWDGKGYGIHLALVDGFVGDDPNLRAPHNAHFDILARSGLPGLVLWIGVLAAFLLTMVRAAWVAARHRLSTWVAVAAWLMAYWLAAVLDMSFDVYLEGPQGGILFWSLTGVGLAVAAIIHDLARRSPDGDRTLDASTAPITAEAFSTPLDDVALRLPSVDELRRRAEADEL